MDALRRKTSSVFWILNIRGVYFVNPSPEGRGWNIRKRRARVRSGRVFLFTPHPPLRVTLSLRERDFEAQRIIGA